MGIEEAILKVKENLEDGRVKDFLQPILDRHFSKSLETWRANHLPDLIKEATTLSESPEQKRTRELQEEVDRMKAENDRAKIEGELMGIAEKYGFPISVAKALASSGDIDTARASLIELGGHINAANEELRTLKASGPAPKGGSATTSNYSLETIGGMSEKEIYDNLPTLTKGK